MNPPTFPTLCVTFILLLSLSSQSDARAARNDRSYLPPRYIRRVASLLTAPGDRQFTGESCRDDGNCAEPRVCLNERLEACPAKGADCKCLFRDEQPKSCNNTTNCPFGDLCYAGGDEKSGRCYSCKFRKDQERNDMEVRGDAECACVAVDALAHLPHDGLVFRAHRRASVLCDAYGSCATPGHIVVYRDAPMSMATYCAREDVSCRRRVKLVNSPRMKRGVRISSFSAHLQFTALAAAGQTQLEETFLTLAVSLGL